MQRAFFISEIYLKENTPLSGNVDMGEVYPHARSAEETYIQEAIGSKLYERLVDSLTASPKNTTADETTLLKKLRDALMWYTCYDALPFLDIKIRNIGIVKQKSDNLENASRDDVSYLRNVCKNKGDFYLRIVQKYLCENSRKFEQYCCGSWNCSEIMPNTNVSNSCDLAFDNDSEDTDFARKWLKNK
jgi:hypothetical protein